MGAFIQGSEAKSKASASAVRRWWGKGVGSPIMLLAVRKGMVGNLGHVKLKERTLAGSTSHG